MTVEMYAHNLGMDVGGSMLQLVLLTVKHFAQLQLLPHDLQTDSKVILMISLSDHLYLNYP